MYSAKFSSITPQGDLITSVPSEFIGEAWPKVEGYLDRAIKRSKNPAFDTEDLKELCLKKDMILWVVVREAEIIAALLTEIIKMPKKKLLSIPWIGGKFMRAWTKPMLAMLENYAKHFKCNALTGSEREGWCRVAGFKPLTTIFVKEI